MGERVHTKRSDRLDVAPPPGAGRRGVTSGFAWSWSPEVLLEQRLDVVLPDLRVRQGSLPWGDLANIDKQTPQRFAANFKTPTLVTHGEKDYRVPVSQGFEYNNTLRLKGVPARLDYFPDENPWILKPQNARLWTREVFAWLEKYLGKGPE